jgi:16S rRNA (guanine966-N2)-methyltransferase
MLEARGAPIEGAAVLDLFAGTGSLGLEALSRGAAHATFVESAPSALGALERNLAALADERGRIIRADWRQALARLAREARRFDLVLLDPPYGRGVAAAAVTELAAAGLVGAGAVVVAEHAASEAMPEAPGAGLEVVRAREFGRTAVTLYAGPDGPARG